jgi:hypothetical protein
MQNDNKRKRDKIYLIHDPIINKLIVDKSDKIPLKYVKLYTIDELLASPDSTETLYLSGGIIDNKFEHYYVPTSIERLKHLIHRFMPLTLKKKQQLLEVVSNELLNYDEKDIEEHHKNQTEQLAKWCWDISSWYCIKAVLTNHNICVFKSPPELTTPVEEEGSAKKQRTSPRLESEEARKKALLEAERCK